VAFVGAFLQLQFPDQFTLVDKPTQISDEMYVIPHVPNQDIFDLELERVPEGTKWLLLHCNFDNAFAGAMDHSLNLSRDQAKRGKSGAEVQYDGGMVTGQSEVTNFLCHLLKADAAAAPRLMLANQNEIRGALEQGAKATTELIERLAEFVQIDELIELMQEELTLGSTANTEAGITAAQAALDDAREAAVKPEMQALDTAIKIGCAALEEAEGQVAEHDALMAKLTDALSVARTQAAERSSALSAQADAEARIARQEADLAAARAVRETAIGESVDALQARLLELANIDRVRHARTEVSQLLGEPARALEDRFEGTLAGLQEEIRQSRQWVTDRSVARMDLIRKAELAESKISTGRCTTCGQDISHLPEVAARNTALRSEADAARRKAEPLALEHKEFKEYVEQLEAVQKEAMPRLQAIDRLGQYVKAADDHLPPTLVWIGGEIPDNVEDEARRIKQTLEQYNADQRKFDAAQHMIGACQTVLEAAQRDLARAQERLAALPEVDTSELQKKVAEGRTLRADLVGSMREAQAELNSAESARKEAVAAYTRALTAKAKAEEQLATRRGELQELTFNNGLLKAVRAARPVIADRLWNLVLSAVTRYFSEMRGTKSKVTKDGDGFKVDGHKATTLSGSTLDILGLAIRVALTRTFLPTAPFLVLDEPAAAMDGDRTELMLGFLVSAGFPQTILVTHEDVSESVADNIITL
jgi:DNA repair exonuclease SbcCD ATPase subunit